MSLVLSVLLGLVGLVVGIPVLLVLVLFSTLLVLQLRNWFWFYDSKTKIPYENEKLFVGGFKTQDMFERYLELSRKHGDMFYMAFLHIPQVVTSDPEVAQYVLAKEVLPKSGVYEQLASLWGDDLVTFTSSGHVWKQRRALVNPAFRMQTLRALTETFGEQANLYARSLRERGPGASVEIVSEFYRLTIDIISRAGFSYALDASGGGAGGDFLRALQAIVLYSANPLLLLPRGGAMLRWWLRKEFGVLDSVFYKVIDERLAQRQRGQQAAEKGGRDLLDMMLEPDDQGQMLTRREIRNELFVFYLAGHETSANILSWTLYELSRHPEVKARVLEEIDNVLGPFDGTFPVPSNEQLEQMSYTTMVLSEILRLYPPVPNLTRTCPDHLKIGSHIVPKNSVIYVSPLLIQRNPDYWPDPDRFDPERFSPQNTGGRHPLSFIPFSAGPRICIGKNFFFSEAKALLACVLRSVNYELDSSKQNGKVSVDTGLLRPIEIWIKPSPRQPAQQ